MQVVHHVPDELILLLGGLAADELNFFFENWRNGAGLYFFVEWGEYFFEFLRLVGTGFLFALDLDLFFIEVDNNFILLVLSEPFKIFFKPFGAFVDSQDASEGGFEESLIEDDTDGGVGVAEWKWEHNNIEEDNKGEYVPVFGDKNECLLHDHVAKDIKQRVLIEHFEYLEPPVGNDLINKIVFFEIKFHGDFIDGKLVKFIDVRLDLKFMLKEVVELEFELLNEVEDIDLVEIGAVGVLVHALELDWVEHLD